MARIIFDLDGTLIDSVPDILGIANTLLANENQPPLTHEQARDYVGNGASVFITRMRAERNIPNSEHTRLLADFIARYDNAVTLTVTYPGVESALQALKTHGHSLGICTNKPVQPAHSVLAYLQLDRYFDTVWGGDSLPVHKPDPAPLRAAFDALPEGIEWYVGDSDVDAETAQNANVPFVLFTEGYRKRPVDAMPHQLAFSHYDDLPGLFSG